MKKWEVWACKNEFKFWTFSDNQTAVAWAYFLMLEGWENIAIIESNQPK